MNKISKILSITLLIVVGVFSSYFAFIYFKPDNVKNGITVSVFKAPSANINADTKEEYLGTFDISGVGTISAITITQYGTDPNPTKDLANVKLIKDNGDGVWNATYDTTQLGKESSFNSLNKASFSGFDLSVPEKTYVHVISDVTSKIVPLPAPTIGVEISEPSDITSTTPISGSWPARLGVSVLNTIYPYLQNVTTDSIEIMWKTDSSLAGKVSYGLTSSYGKTSTETSPATFHKAVISGLLPNTVYHYKVTCGDFTSADSTFKTAPIAGSPFNFIVLGDFGGNSNNPATGFWSTAAKVCEAAADNRNNPKTILLQMGDHTNSGVFDEWQPQFFLPCRNILKNTVSYNVRGNHDTIGDGPSAFSSYFSPPTIGGSGSNLYYSFNYGNVHFILLDGNQSLGEGSPQRKWIANDLASPSAISATWRIVSIHQSPYTYSSGHEGVPEEQDLATKVLAPGGVNIVFSGHNHLYQRLFKAEGKKGGITYIIEGRNGGTTVSPTSPHPLQQAAYNSDFGYTRVEVGVETITIKAYNTSNVVIDTAEIKKN